MNIYLDIDGVLLTNNLQPANHVEDFLRYLFDHYPNSVYWLTTHCNGDASIPIQHIGHLFSPEGVKLLRKIKPTSWHTAKTRGIDFSEPFLWFDDNLFYEEKETLTQRSLMDNWIEVNLSKNPDILRDFINSFPIPIQIS